MTAYRAGRGMAPAKRRVRKGLEQARQATYRVPEPPRRTMPLPRGNWRWGSSWCCIHDATVECWEGAHVIVMFHPPIKTNRRRVHRRRDTGGVDGGYLLALAVIIAVVLVYVAAGGAR